MAGARTSVGGQRRGQPDLQPFRNAALDRASQRRDNQAAGNFGGTVLAMTTSANQTPLTGSDGASGAAGSGSVNTETLCLQLGWSMQRLYRARPVPERDHGQVPDRLPGLSRLSRIKRIEIDLGRARTCLGGIAGALGWTASQTPSLDLIQARLTAPAEEAAVTAYKAAVLDAHRSLLTRIAAAGAKLGKAYGLGRALADTARPGQGTEDVQGGFEPHRLAQLRHDLNDLASVLPPHSAKAVAQSLTWWRDAVYLADGTETGAKRRQLLANVRTDAPALRRPKGIINPKITATSTRGDLDRLRQALPRQGELWRVVLTGEKKPLDLLKPDDYLEAARRAAARGRQLAAQTFLAAPKTTIALVLVASLVLAGVLTVVWLSHASSGGKLAAFLVAVGGYFGSLARAAMPRLKAGVQAAQQPLWQSALDYVSAECISVPPVGRPDSEGWSHLATAPDPAVPGPGDPSAGRDQTIGAASSAGQHRPERPAAAAGQSPVQ